LVALAVPARKGSDWIEAFFRGLLRLAKRTGTGLAGGDLAHGDKVHCSVMVVGVVPKGTGLRRDGARPGDAIYVSGRLGKPWDRPIRPRLKLGRELLSRATACMDLSDGLALDLHRLCLASRVAAELNQVPRFAGASLDRALHGGEDYELLFTLPNGAQPPRGTIRIGTVRDGRAGEMFFKGSRLEPKGYDHFGTISESP
jgi:thiamine-monophosphate kinase